MPKFSDFDSRHYKTVDVRSGYGEWVDTYERTVEDEMDLALLRDLVTPPWDAMHLAADLACGTGRTGAWLRSRGVAEIDGVDLTPEMLVRARAKGVYRRLEDADIASTLLETGAYDLVTACLVDEHLPDLAPLYREAARLARPYGLMVVVAYHPHFIMVSGMPTHFNSRSGEPVAIETHLHLLSDHVAAALDQRWVLREMKERLIDEAWLALKPKWERLRHHPISFALVWQKEP
jgi:SAM-dependent methyltransferase